MTDPQPAHNDFVNANGVCLHYLDWGGNGPAFIFLAGYAWTSTRCTLR